MPPEVLNGVVNHDPRLADVFSSGVILFILMTRQVLFNYASFKYSSYRKF